MAGIDRHEERLLAIEKEIKRPLLPPVVTNRPNVRPYTAPVRKIVETPKVRINSSASSDEAWARYRKRIEQGQIGGNDINEQKYFGMTPLTLIVVAIISLICFSAIMSVADKSSDQPARIMGTYPPNWNP